MGSSVCKLKKAPNELKQALKVWFQKLMSTLFQLHFTQYKVDTSIYVEFSKAQFIVILIYVDDIIITISNEKFIQQMIGDLHGIFSLMDLGDLNYFFGIQVQHNGDSLHLNQHKYVMSLVTKDGLASAKPLLTPMSSTTRLSKFNGDPLDDIALYQ